MFCLNISRMYCHITHLADPPSQKLLHRSRLQNRVDRDSTVAVSTVQWHVWSRLSGSQQWVIDHRECSEKSDSAFRYSEPGRWTTVGGEMWADYSSRWLTMLPVSHSRCMITTTAINPVLPLSLFHYLFIFLMISTTINKTLWHLTFTCSSVCICLMRVSIHQPTTGNSFVMIIVLKLFFF